MQNSLSSMVLENQVLANEGVEWFSESCGTRLRPLRVCQGLLGYLAALPDISPGPWSVHPLASEAGLRPGIFSGGSEAREESGEARR